MILTVGDLVGELVGDLVGLEVGEVYGANEIEGEKLSIIPQSESYELMLL